MDSLYTIVGYLIVAVIFYKVFTLVSGALKLILTLVFGALSVYVLYVVFGGFLGAIR